MAAMYGSIVDALHAVDRMLAETPGGRYLVWQILKGDPWNVNLVDGKDQAFSAACVPKFHGLMIVDSDVLDSIECIAEGIREGG
jgi:hypothetical protein